MAPLKHIYPIRNEEIIGELSEDQVRIGKLEIEVERLNKFFIRQTEINKTMLEVLTDLNSRKL